MRRKMEAERLPTKDWPTGDLSLLRRSNFRARLADECFSVLVCAELSYTNSQIWFIRFDVDQSSKLVCVGNQAGEIFVWMLSGTEFVQVLKSKILNRFFFAIARRFFAVPVRSRAWQVGSCSSKKYPACVRQTALAATGASHRHKG